VCPSPRALTDEGKDAYRVQRLPPALAGRPLIGWKRPHLAEQPRRTERLNEDGDGDGSKDPAPAAQEEDAGEEAAERLTEWGREVEAASEQISVRCKG
jgi:hypothetical protein